MLGYINKYRTIKIDNYICLELNYDHMEPCYACDAVKSKQKNIPKKR